MKYLTTILLALLPFIGLAQTTPIYNANLQGTTTIGTTTLSNSSSTTVATGTWQYTGTVSFTGNTSFTSPTYTNPTLSGTVTIPSITNNIAYVNGSNVLGSLSVGSGLSLSLGTLSDSLTFSSPLVRSSAAITINQASASSSGYLSSSDWSAFNAKQSALSTANSTTSGILSSTDWNTFNNKQATLPAANGSTNGYLTSTDWTTFNNKQGPLTFTSPLVNTFGSVTILQAGASTSGYLSSTDWNTFNNKLSATNGTSSQLLGSNGTGGFNNITLGTGLSLSGTTLNATGGGSGITTYLNIAGLRAASTSGLSNGTITVVAGALNAGDGGGQTFVWNSSSTATDNGGTNQCGTIINPTGHTGSGRWLSLMAMANITYSGTYITNNTYDVRWFGAIPDQGATNASIGILDAWNALAATASGPQFVGTLRFPAGFYYCKSACDFTKNVSGAYNYQVNFIGDGPGSTYIIPVLASTGICWKMGNNSTSQSITTLTVKGFSFNGLSGDRYGSTTLQIQNIQNCFVSEIEMGIQSNGFNLRSINYLSLANTKVTVSTPSGLSTGGLPYNIYLSGGIINNIQASQGGPLVNSSSGGATQYAFPCMVLDSCNSLRVNEVNFTGAGQYNSSSQYPSVYFGGTGSSMNETSISGIFQDSAQGGSRSANTCSIYVDGSTTYGTAKLQIHDSLFDIGDYGVVLNGVSQNVQQIQITNSIGNNIHYGVYAVNVRHVDINNFASGGATTSQSTPTNNSFVYIGGTSNEVHITGLNVRNTNDGGVLWYNGVQIDGTNVTGVSVTASKFGVQSSPIYLTSSASTTSQYLDFYNNSYAIGNAYYGKTGSRVTLSSPQSIPNDTGTPYALSWGSASPNDLSIYSSGNPTRLTVPAGIYKVRITSNIVWYSNNTSYRVLMVKKNGVTAYAQNFMQALGNSSQSVDTGTIDVVPGDYFEIYVQQGSGGALNVDTYVTNAEMLINP